MYVVLGLEPLDPLHLDSKVGDPSSSATASVQYHPRLRRLPGFWELIPVRDADREIPYGGHLQSLGIERYDSKVAVAWRMAPLPDGEAQYADELAVHDRDTEVLPEQQRKMMRQRFLHQLSRPAGDKLTPLADNLGTEYRHTGGGSSGGGNEQTGRAQFMPAIPEGASMLTVRWDDLEFPVSISDSDEAK
jgi:hypothetical protein